MTLKSDRIREQLRDIQIRREQIIEEITRKNELERLQTEELELRAALESLERVESRARHAIPPSAEESALWKEIRELMETQAGILRERPVPEKYIRPDAVEFILGDFKERRAKLQEWYKSLRGNQSAGPRYIAEKNALDQEEENFNARLKPLCLAGVRLFEIKQKIETLSAKRNELKAAREAAGLATV